MKFNHSELAAYCNSKRGKADKEGTLWMKERRSEGLFTKKEGEILASPVCYTSVGNMLSRSFSLSQTSV